MAWGLNDIPSIAALAFSFGQGGPGSGVVGGVGGRGVGGVAGGGVGGHASTTYYNNVLWHYLIFCLSATKVADYSYGVHECHFLLSTAAIFPCYGPLGYMVGTETGKYVHALRQLYTSGTMSSNQTNFQDLESSLLLYKVEELKKGWDFNVSTTAEMELK